MGFGYQESEKVKGTAIICPYCQSVRTVYEEPKVEVKEDEHIETWTVHCLDCGSRGNITEVWNRLNETNIS